MDADMIGAGEDLDAVHGATQQAAARPDDPGRFSFTGSVLAGPDFASTSQDTLNRDLCSREDAASTVISRYRGPGECLVDDLRLCHYDVARQA